MACVKDRFLPPPKVDIFAAGFVCKARSRLNSQRAGSSCVRLQQATTGESWAMISKYIAVHQPRAVMLENVVVLGPVIIPTTPTSD